VAPPVQFAKSGDVRIAYQVVGDGPVDLVSVGGPASHLDMMWDEPLFARGLERLASFSRLILHDRRGTGLSDPASGPPTLEQQMDDMLAVIDAVGAERPAVYGQSEGGQLCALFAATHPERTSALVLFGCSPRGSAVMTPAVQQTFLDAIENQWGQAALLPVYAPSMQDDERFKRWWIRYERAAFTPAMARRVGELLLETDITDVLPAIRVPTLVMHRRDDTLIPLELGQEFAHAIPGAKFVVLEGTDQFSFSQDAEAAHREVEEFLTGAHREPETERMLATILFTDIVRSTELASELRDRRWHDLVEAHDALVRRELERFRGREVKTLGDGFLALFDGPARGIRCAQRIVSAASELGVRVRAGLHTGECELVDDDVRGMAVNIGARVGALADDGEVLVSGTVKDLVVGSEIAFEDRGEHSLKGVPGEWRLYAVGA
jgi:pimeloyl-ACP methyl ester carboxylesterase